MCGAGSERGGPPYGYLVGGGGFFGVGGGDGVGIVVVADVPFDLEACADGEAEGGGDVEKFGGACFSFFGGGSDGLGWSRHDG